MKAGVGTIVLQRVLGATNALLHATGVDQTSESYTTWCKRWRTAADIVIQYQSSDKRPAITVDLESVKLLKDYNSWKDRLATAD